MIVRYGELWTKSEVTRRRMESALLDNIRAALSDLEFRVRRWRGRIFVDSPHAEAAADRLSRVFGVVSVSPAATVEKDLESISQAALALARGRINPGMSFAVRAHRADKRFPLTSPEIQRKIGGKIKAETRAKVDLKSPDVEIWIEISDRAYVYDRIIRGPGGLPYGTQGRAVMLFSGGIDSPVAAWMVARRGVRLDFLFFNPGVPEAEAHAYRVYRYLRDRWYVSGEFYVYDGSEVAWQILSRVREGLRQVVLKRVMYRLAQELARRTGALAIVTGESIGQVSSQTLTNLAAIEESVEIPVIRPLAGLDKDETVSWARRIGTYDLSIQIREFCSLERHSNASATLEEVVREEEKLKFDPSNAEFRGHLPAPRDRAPPPAGVVVINLEREDVRLDELKPETPYVFVCRAGVSARLYAEKARERGIEAYALSEEEARELGLL